MLYAIQAVKSARDVRDDTLGANFIDAAVRGNCCAAAIVL
jgi:hypothetical protein